jgi:hypothetical protein
MTILDTSPEGKDILLSLTYALWQIREEIVDKDGLLFPCFLIHYDPTHTDCAEPPRSPVCALCRCLSEGPEFT